MKNPLAEQYTLGLNVLADNSLDVRCFKQYAVEIALYANDASAAHPEAKSVFTCAVPLCSV